MAEKAEIELNGQISVAAAYVKSLADLVNEVQPWLNPTEVRLSPYAARTSARSCASLSFSAAAARTESA